MPRSPSDIHPDCRRMHEELHLCICLTVACAACLKHHAPHKPCPKPKAEQPKG